MNKMIIVISLLIMILSIPANAKYIELRGKIANETANPGDKDFIDISKEPLDWGARRFDALFLDIDNDLLSEHLIIYQKLNGTSRTINKGNLAYITDGNHLTFDTKKSSTRKMLNVVRYAFGGNYALAKARGLYGFDKGQMSAEAGKFRVIGWLGSRNVAIKNQTYKLGKQIIEQNTENITLSKGQIWNVGGNWSIKAQEIDSKSVPRQVWLFLYYNNIMVDNRIISEKNIYTYVNKSFAGETDVPLFVTYIDSIYPGSSSDYARLKYTWAISNPKIIRVGNTFGKLKVVVANRDIIISKNVDYPITLSRGANIYLYEPTEFKAGIKVADKPFLRFYPNTYIKIN